MNTGQILPRPTSHLERDTRYLTSFFLRRTFVSSTMVRPNVPPPQQGPTVVTSVTRTHDPDVLYEEKYQPCFIWTLILGEFHDGWMDGWMKCDTPSWCSRVVRLFQRWPRHKKIHRKEEEKTHHDYLPSWKFHSRKF